MTKISIDLNWKLDKGTLSPGKYSNIHEIKFNSNISVKADSAPDWNGDPKILIRANLAASLRVVI